VLGSKNGVARVDGMLAVSRALGDLALAPHVSSEPATRSVDLSAADEWLLLACDGVWDVLSDDDAAAIVLETADAAAKEAGAADAAAAALVDAALAAGTTDNVSVLLVRLQSRASLGQQLPDCRRRLDRPADTATSVAPPIFVVAPGDERQTVPGHGSSSPVKSDDDAPPSSPSPLAELVRQMATPGPLRGRAWGGVGSYGCGWRSWDRKNVES
jgi:hypothetical protein